MGLKSVKVVRVGHRYVRDYRTLTHLCLVSRALGAEAIYLEEVEKELEETVAEVNRTWGGDFAVVEGKWKRGLPGREGGGEGDGPPDDVRHPAAGRDRRS